MHALNHLCWHCIIHERDEAIYVCTPPFTYAADRSYDQQSIQICFEPCRHACTEPLMYALGVFVLPI